MQGMEFPRFGELQVSVATAILGELAGVDHGCSGERVGDGSG